MRYTRLEGARPEIRCARLGARTPWARASEALILQIILFLSAYNQGNESLSRGQRDLTWLLMDMRILESKLLSFAYW